MLNSVVGSVLRPIVRSIFDVFGTKPSPSLSLNFVTAPSLDPRITFTRASNATVTNSAGVIAYAPHNLLTYSEQFDNAAWTKSGATVAANTTTAPDGTTTADKLVEDTSTGFHRAFQGPSFSAGLGYVFSVYLKAGERTQAWFQLRANNYVGDWAVNLLTGIASTPSAPTGQTISVVNAGNGWWRVDITQSATTSTSGFGNVIIMAGNGSANVYTGDGTSGIFLWGAQLNVGALQPYYPTTVKNLLGFTQEFDNAAWTKSNSSITANATTAPDGSLTADKLVEDTATSSHRVLQPFTPTSGTIYTASAYIKAAERGFAFLGFVGGSMANTFVAVNLATGAISNALGTPLSSNSVSLGNGWYRVSVSLASTGTTTSNVDIRVSTNGLWANQSYTGDGTSGIFIWGAQLSDSASLDEYRYNPVAAPAAAAYYGPRFDYDPVTLAPKGLLIEEQRTNSIRNNTMQGAVAGTPGTLPTDWSAVGTFTGLTQQIVGTGLENGINYIDIKVSGTPAGTFLWDIAINPVNQTAASNGQTWTQSAYYSLAAGALTNVTITGVLLGRDSGGGFVAGQINGVSVAPTSASLSSQRRSSTFTFNSASVAFAQQRIRFSFTSGQAVDFTLRIGLPQLELGAFATSVIPTTTAAATRAADVATMIGANFSNWYNQAAGSPYFEGATYSTSGTSCGISIDDNTINNRIQLRRNITGPSSSFRMVSSGGAIDIGFTSGTLLGVNKIAVGATASDQAAASNGALFTGITSITPMPTVTQMQIGNGPGSTIWNGTIRRIAYFPRRLSNTELVALTN